MARTIAESGRRPGGGSPYGAPQRPGTTLGGQNVTRPQAPVPASNPIGQGAPLTGDPSSYVNRQRLGLPAIPGPAAKAPTAPTGPRISGGGGGSTYGGGGLGTYATGLVAESEPPQPQTFDDWRNAGGFGNDSAFLAEDASAEAEYQALLNQLTQQNTSYMQDFKGGLRNLGWDYEGEDYGNGKWDADDRLGAYGGAFQNLQNDYSGRGLLDSSFYGQANNDLTDRFNRQRTDMMTGLTGQQNDFNSNKTNALQSREAAKNRALAEAYARYSGGYGV